MRTPKAFPELTETIVQIASNSIKEFAAGLTRVRSRCSPKSSDPSAPPGAVTLLGRGTVSAEAMQEAEKLQQAFATGHERLAAGDGVKDLGEILEPVRNLDSLLRDMALSSATHWFTHLVERFIGPCHVGKRFVHDGAAYIFHGYRNRKVFLVTGPCSVVAAYYTREGGGNGLYPIDLVLGLDASGCTREAAFLMAHFACESDYPQAQALIRRATGLEIDQNRLHSRIDTLGEIAMALQQEPPNAETAKPCARMVVETDGLMVPMRYDPTEEDPEKAKEGWHEAHVGVVGIPQAAKPEEPKYHRKDRSPEAHEKTKADANRDVELAEQTYVATYEGREAHLRKLKAEAVRRGWSRETKTLILGDGSPWVHDETAPLFPRATHVLDWQHSVEHLGEVRDLAYKPGSPEGAAWIARAEANLWEGNRDAVIHSIRYLAGTSHKAAAEKLRAEAKYFRKRKHLMDYPAYRAAGWPIGSGAVESACRHVVQERCKCSGMRWSTRGIQRIMSVRTTIIGDRFDELWAAHALQGRAKMVA